MSRYIENDHLYTDEEVEYLEGRRRIYEIEQNRLEFGGDSEEAKETEPVQLSEEVVDWVKSLSDDEVDAELKKAGLANEGSDKERKFALANYIQSKKDAAK